MLTVKKRKILLSNVYNLTDKRLLKTPETFNFLYRALKHAKNRQTGSLALSGIGEVSFAAKSYL